MVHLSTMLERIAISRITNTKSLRTWILIASSRPGLNGASSEGGNRKPDGFRNSPVVAAVRTPHNEIRNAERCQTAT